MNANYEVKIAESTRELSKREAVMFKDTTNAIKLDEACDGEKLVISPADYVVLAVHNEKADGDKDYKQYLILDTEGNKYITGSDSFFNTFKSIFDEMVGENYDIEIYKVDSKNYKGKQFITCSLI